MKDGIQIVFDEWESAFRKYGTIHDESHAGGELGKAAAAYALRACAKDDFPIRAGALYPFSNVDSFMAVTDEMKMLARAGGFIVSEINRRIDIIRQKQWELFGFLLKFCAEYDDHREELMEPFYFGDFVCFTCARIIIRIRRQEDADDMPRLSEKFPNHHSVKRLMELMDQIKFVHVRDWEPSPSLPEQKYEIDDDDGEVYAAQNPIMFGNRRVNAEYLRKINYLGNVFYNVKSGGERDPIQFRFGGGEGLLMPMKPEGEP